MQIIRARFFKTSKRPHLRCWLNGPSLISSTICIYLTRSRTIQHLFYRLFVRRDVLTIIYKLCFRLRLVSPALGLIYYNESLKISQPCSMLIAPSNSLALHGSKYIAIHLKVLIENKSSKCLEAVGLIKTLSLKRQCKHWHMIFRFVV